ncbi:hypothetical protein [Lactiplantibacillus paraplantarum]|uniref:hypothetical protein n=1 Tax=Lactiplantibacillus paraplantarum TaxID=60520 RepID=UPI0023AAC252|nr:hypothetical protein [Lactiplantibacillus paraplantarum]WEE36062.1 hypothetical protein PWO93_00280 [Lactiplantibacillus paraplantarum]
MKIKVAKDLKDGKIYPIKELLTLPEDSEILDRLVCVNCACLLTLTHASFNQSAYLKTRNGQKHNQSCANFFEHEERKELLITGRVVNGRLDERAVSQRLKRMDKLLFGPEEEPAKPKSKPNSNKPNKPSEVTTDGTKRRVITRVIPTTNPQVGFVDDTQNGHVRMKYRKIKELSRQSIGQTVATGGYLIDVKLSDDREHATIVLEFEGAKLNVRLRPDIFQYQIGLFNRVRTLSSRLGSLDGRPRVTALLEVGVDAKGQLEAVLRDETTISFNGQRLSVFISRAV